jgi:hypothetical protein
MTFWLWIALVSNVVFWSVFAYLVSRRRSDVTVTHEQNENTPQAENGSPALRFSYYCGSPIRQLNSFRRRDSL